MLKEVSRRRFISTTGAVLPAMAAAAPQRKEPASLQIGFHTGAFNSSSWNFEQCLDWAQKNGLHSIECGFVDGVVWSHGLGYYPHIASWEDPLALRRKMDKLDISLAQIDAAFPLSRPEGMTLGVEYAVHAIRWAKLFGCPRVDTTDDLKRPAGMTDREGIEHLRRVYLQIVPVAEAYKVVINIEPHGYFTTKPDFVAEMLAFANSPYLMLNLDTGNTFIAGQDPVAFLERFKERVNHLHIKDVSAELAASVRGKVTGMAGASPCAIGTGANATNIRRCIEILVANGYNGVLSMECEGQGGPLIEKSLAWLRETIKTANEANRRA